VRDRVLFQLPRPASSALTNQWWR